MPAFHAGKALADGVHLHDVRAAGKELPRDVLQLFSGNERLFKQGTAAAGQQEQHDVLRVQAVDKFQCFLGRGEAVGIRHGVSGFIAAHTGDVAFHVVVFGDDDAVLHGTQRRNSGVRHLPCRFSGGDQKDPPLRAKIFQSTPDGFIRQDCLNAGRDDLVCGLAQGAHRKFLLWHQKQFTPFTAARPRSSS